MTMLSEFKNICPTNIEREYAITIGKIYNEDYDLNDFVSGGGETKDGDKYEIPHTPHQEIIRRIKFIRSKILRKGCDAELIVKLLFMDVRELKDFMRNTLNDCFEFIDNKRAKPQKTKDKEFVIGKRYTNGIYTNMGYIQVFTITKKTQHFYTYDITDYSDGEEVAGVCVNFRSKKIMPINLESNGKLVVDKTTNIRPYMCYNADEYFEFYH